MSVAWLLIVAAPAALAELGARRASAGGSPSTSSRHWPRYLALALLAMLGEPPLAVLAHQSLWAQTLQFGLLAFAVTPLAVLGAPRRLADAPSPPSLRPTTRARTVRGLAALACFLTVTIGWRVPAAVDAAASGPAWLAAEAGTVVAGTWWLWSQLVGKSSRPGLIQPRTARVALAAAATWSVWIFAYVLGFSAHPFYPAFAGKASAVPAQQFAVVCLLGTSAIALLPVFFTNLVRWLATDQAEAESEMAATAGQQWAPGGAGD